MRRSLPLQRKEDQSSADDDTYRPSRMIPQTGVLTMNASYYNSVAQYLSMLYPDPYAPYHDKFISVRITWV